VLGGVAAKLSPGKEGKETYVLNGRLEAPSWPLYFKPNCVHLSLASKLVFIPFSRKLRIGPA
jgi:hypothetical protein